MKAISDPSFEALLAEVRACARCADALPHGPRPVLQLHPDARILVAGQAPGRRVHHTGLPFSDPSGDRLRDWMGIGRETFYDPRLIAVVPMGLCYPGSGPRGDAPPRPECAETWRARLMAQLPRLELTLAVGRYALRWHFGHRRGSLAAVVREWREDWPRLIPAPHPSPRNNLWLRRHAWFEREVVPALRDRVRQVLEK